MPPLPDDELTSPRALALDAVDVRREQLRGLVRGAARMAVHDAPRVMRHPVAAAVTAVRNVQAVVRIMKPPTERLSPIMVERRGWWRFAVLDVDLTALRAVAKSHNATVNDTFLAALGNGFARYHEKNGAPVERLRGGRRGEHPASGDSPHGNHVAGGSFVMPVGTDDPAKYLAIYHDAVAVIREDVGQPLAEALGTAMAVFGPFVSGLMGAILKNCDFAATNVPGIDVPLYMGGAEMLASRGRPCHGHGRQHSRWCPTATTPASVSTPTPPPSSTSMCSSSACARASTPSSPSPSNHSDYTDLGGSLAGCVAATMQRRSRGATSIRRLRRGF